MDLDLLQYKANLQVESRNGQPHIFDLLRKKWLVFTPEELVRQLMVYFLLGAGYNKNHISLEKGIMVNKLLQRFDLLVHTDQLDPFLLIECKAPEIEISENVFEQVSWYNKVLKAPYILVTNGRNSFCAAVDHQMKTYEFLEELPMPPVIS